MLCLCQSFLNLCSIPCILYYNYYTVCTCLSIKFTRINSWRVGAIFYSLSHKHIAQYLAKSKTPSEEAKQLWKPDADVAKRLILSGSEFKVTMNNTLGDLMGKTQAARTNGYARQRNGN